MYNNIKKITLSGLVACLVVGFSAFTNVEEETKLAPFYYGNSGGGLYQKITGAPIPGNCHSMDSNPCILVSPTTEVDSFRIGEPEAPTDLEVESSSPALYF